MKYEGATRESGRGADGKRSWIGDRGWATEALYSLLFLRKGAPRQGGGGQMAGCGWASTADGGSERCRDEMKILFPRCNLLAFRLMIDLSRRCKPGDGQASCTVAFGKEGCCPHKLQIGMG